jgi:hypothetical protein
VARDGTTITTVKKAIAKIRFMVWV